VSRQLAFDDPPYQAHSRTSREAAQMIAQPAVKIREQVYWYIVAHGPCTDQSISRGLGLSENTTRPRRVELVAAGMVRCDPELGVTSSGRRANRWVSCEPF
jgi:predicted ArsR family transcriptional regulator